MIIHSNLVYSWDRRLAWSKDWRHCTADRRYRAAADHDGESGLLFPALDARALTECLLRLDRDPGLAGRLGNRASADYRQLATLDAVLDRYLQLYSG